MDTLWTFFSKSICIYTIMHALGTDNIDEKHSQRDTNILHCWRVVENILRVVRFYVIAYTVVHAT